MAMNLSTSSSTEPDVMADINTTPLIDVMLVLLIMLIITIPVQTHAVKLNMPVSSPAKPLSPPIVIKIDIDFDGTVIWNGEVIDGLQLLEDRLTQLAKQSEQP